MYNHSINNSPTVDSYCPLVGTDYEGHCPKSFNTVVSRVDHCDHWDLCSNWLRDLQPDLEQAEKKSKQ